MHGHSSAQVGIGLEQALVPDFGLAARIGKDQRRLGGFYHGQEVGQQSDAQMSCPWDLIETRRKHRMYLNLFFNSTFDKHPFAFGSQKHFECIVQIADGG